MIMMDMSPLVHASLPRPSIKIFRGWLARLNLRQPIADRLTSQVRHTMTSTGTSSMSGAQPTRIRISLAGHTLSQERVWYVTMQLIVLADSGCRVYTQSHSIQTTLLYVWGELSTPQMLWGLEQQTVTL